VLLDTATPDDRPSIIMRAALPAPPCGLYALGDTVHVVCEQELFVFNAALHLVQQLALSEKPTRVVPLAHGFAVAGTGGLVLIRQDEAGKPTLQYEPYASAWTEMSSFGALIVLTGVAGSDLFTPKQSGLRRVAHYARPHWSIGFVPDAVRFGRLCRLIPSGELQLWDVNVHHLDRAPFKSAFELRYSSPKILK
jgi:hypothetical protein